MRLAPFIAAIAVVVVAGTASANNPDPNQSSFGPFVGRSPNNVAVGNPIFQYTYAGVLRNAAGQPISGFDNADVELRILAPCQNPIVLNPDADSDANGNVVWGVAAMQAAGGGSCQGVGPDAPVVEVHVLGIGLFESLNSVTSPDEDGNDIVDLGDFVTLRAAFLTGSPLYQGDLNGDGLITLADISFFQQHF
jgi:hypothetical protein